MKLASNSFLQEIFSGIVCIDRSNSHQNSHSPKSKKAADLAASHLIVFIVLLAPQVGLEPTTLRLTARDLPCSAVLDIALSCLLLGRYSNELDRTECRDYPVLPAFFKHVPYKSPYSVFEHFRPERLMPKKARSKLACRCQLSCWASRICHGSDSHTPASPIHRPHCDAHLQMQAVGIPQQLLNARLGDSSLKQAAHR